MRYLLFALALVQAFFVVGQKKQLTLEEIFLESKFHTKSVYGLNFLKDGNYSVLEKQGAFKSVIKYDLVTQDKLEELYNPNEIEQDDHRLKVQSYSFNEDESKLLLVTEKEKIYRHSYKAKHFVWTVASQEMKEVSANGKQQTPKLSPNGEVIAFVRDNNIYISDLNGDEYPITTDGEKNKVINGLADWVYEEEFVTVDAFQWSPDGKYIAFLKFDEEEVKQFAMPMYGSLYPEPYVFKYPKAGEKNSLVSLHIYNVATKETKEVNVGPETDQYISRINWTRDAGVLSFYRVNRHQNKLEMLKVDAKSMKVEIVLTEENERYVDVNDFLYFMNNGKEFLWVSEVDGHNHIYLYDMNGNLVRQITKGDFDVTDFYGIDEDNSVLYYQAASRNAMQREVYSVGLNGEDIKLLTKNKGWNRAVFNGNFTYFMNYYSNATTPTIVDLRTNEGKVKVVKEENKEIQKQLAEYDIAKHEFIEVPLEDGTKLNGYMYKPSDFDSKKQYPVFMYVYGGPGSQTVQDSWSQQNVLWYSHLADQGYIVVSVDNRGTGARGQEFKKMTYMQLGKYEVEDQISVAKYLGSLKFVDQNRIGIFGWSYGGYMSTSCLAKGAEFFKMAIAVAPVSNWRYYDSIYTERYMRTPQENEKGYDDNSPINHTDKIKGNYLLIHGTADDNVHFQNAVELTDALVKSGVQFDNMYYPNKNHGIYGGNTRYHLYTKMTNFIKNNL